MTKRIQFVKIITLLLALAFIICSLFAFTACTGYTAVREEYYTIGYNERNKEAFIGKYYWHGHLGKDMDITLPNTYNDMPITKLGGYVGTGLEIPFFIEFFMKSDLEKELFGELNTASLGTGFGHDVNRQYDVLIHTKDWLESNSITKEFEIVDIVFNLHIGSNLKEIENVDYVIASKDIACVDNEEDEIVTVYAFSFEITVDEQNEYFYSDDLGRMYYKENNKLVKTFLYHNRDSFSENSL